MFTATAAFQAAIVIMTLLCLYKLYNVQTLGIKVRQSVLEADRKDVLTYHKRAVDTFLVWLMFLVVGIVVYVSFGFGHAARHPHFNYVHEAFATAVLALLLAARFWITGERYPHDHKWIVWSAIMGFVIVAVSGMLLTYL
jgi:hypothetical protein